MTKSAKRVENSGIEGCILEAHAGREMQTHAHGCGGKGMGESGGSLLELYTVHEGKDLAPVCLGDRDIIAQEKLAQLQKGL